MTHVHLIQSEESGIPQEPEVFIDLAAAEAAWERAWRDAYAADGYKGADLDRVVARRIADDYGPWPENGGVRWFEIEVPGVITAPAPEPADSEAVAFLKRAGFYPES